MTMPRDNHQDLDRLLDSGSGDLGDLYRRLPRMEPPRRLDRAVLGEAARAVRGRPPRRHRWMVGLGSAAGLVLAAGVAWHVGQDALRQQSPNSAQRGMIVVPVEPITETRRKRAPPSETKEAATISPPQTTPTAAKPGLSRKAEARPVAKPAPTPPASAAAPPPTASPAVEPDPFPAESRMRDETATSAGAAAMQAEQDVAAKNEPAAAALKQPESKRVRTEAPPAPLSSVELRRDMQLAPDDWLAHIEQLLHQGRRQQAIESLRLFQHVYPNRSLPPNLHALDH